MVKSLEASFKGKYDDQDPRRAVHLVQQKVVLSNHGSEQVPTL